MTPPTPAEVEELARELMKFHCPSASEPLRIEYDDATWILTRFVRREEAEQRIENLKAWIDSYQRTIVRLRDELRGQRCVNGLIEVCEVVHGDHVWRRCVGCPACKPAATPKGDECECGHPVVHHSSLGCHASVCHCHRSRATFNSDGGRTPESVSTAEKRLSQGAPAQVTGASGQSESTAASSKAASAAPVPVEHLVKLHPETLRALVAVMLCAGDWNKADSGCVVALTDSLLAKLKETKG